VLWVAHDINAPQARATKLALNKFTTESFNNLFSAWIFTFNIGCLGLPEWQMIPRASADLKQHHCSVFWPSTLPYLPWITNVKNVKKSQHFSWLLGNSVWRQ